MNEVEQLQVAIDAIESQRALLGDAVVDAALASLKDKLASLTSHVGLEQRKRVTILFADLVGFTSMSEKNDPEDVQEILERYFAQWSHSIEQFGGTIDKFIGDAVMAIFGLPTTHEDDPERAILAALSMKHTLEALNLDCKTEFGLTLSMRVGIHTGLVVVSRSQEGTVKDFEVVGDAVNLASRLESVAPVNSILISQDTYRSVKGMFDMQSLGDIHVKGKREPVQAYVVQRAKPRVFRVEPRGVEGVETPLIGRDAEFQQLQEIFHLARQGNAGLVTIVGEAGIGKSRLAAEFHDWLDLLPDLVWMFKGRAGNSTRSTPYFLLRDLMAFRFEVMENDSQETVRFKLENGIGQFIQEDAQLKAHFLGAWLGYEMSDSPHLGNVRNDPRQLSDRALNYLVEFFAAITRISPAVVLLEDIHWSDGQSLEALHALVRRAPTLRLLILSTARPSLLEQNPDWETKKGSHQVIRLESLPADRSHQLIEAILQKVPSVPTRLVDLIVERSEGNPFFVEELIKMLIEDGIINTDADPWHVDQERVNVLQVPPSLTQVLQARLDNLPAFGRSAIQRAAVVGRVFWEMAVSQLIENGRQTVSSDSRNLTVALALLNEREMIFPRERSAFEGTREFIFKHALLREVTYENILKRDRKNYHARVARWLAEVAEQNGRSDEFAGLIGEHYAHASENLLAAGWLHRAGSHAITQSAYPEAVRLLSQALELVGQIDPAQQVKILFNREDANRVLGNRPEQLQDLETVNEQLEAAGAENANPEWVVKGWPELHLRWANYFDVTGDYQAHVEHARMAAALAQASSLVEQEARAHLTWGSGHWRLAEYAPAIAQYEKALQLARQESLSEIEANCLRQLGVVADTMGDYQLARRFFEDALELFRQQQALRGVARSLNSLGVAALHLREFALARSYLEESLPMYRQIGDRYGEGVVLSNLANLFYAEGNWKECHACFQRSLDLCREIEDQEGEAAALNGLGTIVLSVGQWKQAEDYFNQGLEICCRIGDRQGESGILVGMSQLFAALGDDLRAVEVSRKALEIARQVEIEQEAEFALIYLGQSLARLGRWDEAVRAYQEARDARSDQERQSFDALAGLADVALQRGDPAQAMDYIEPILAYLSQQGIQGLDNPMLIYWICYRVLRSTQDPRGQEILTIAVRTLQAKADTLDDPAIKQSFLENVPANTALLEAWKTISDL